MASTYRFKGISNANSSFDVSYLEEAIDLVAEDLNLAKQEINAKISDLVRPGGHHHYCSDIQLNEDGTGIDASMITSGEVTRPIASTGNIKTKAGIAKINANGIQTQSGQIIYNGLPEGGSDTVAHYLCDSEGVTVGKLETTMYSSGIVKTVLGAYNKTVQGNSVSNEIALLTAKDGSTTYEISNYSNFKQVMHIPEIISGTVGFMFSADRLEDSKTVTFTKAFSASPIIVTGAKLFSGSHEAFRKFTYFIRNYSETGFTVDAYMSEGDNLTVFVDWLAIHSND